MTKPHNNPIIVWFRRDLRLKDNAALACAAECGRPVIAVYVHEPSEMGNRSLGAAQAWWLHHSLKGLAAALEGIGSRLVLRSGSADAALGALIAETGATSVFWNRRYDPSGIAVDSSLKEELTRTGLTVRSFSGQLLHEPTCLKTGAGGPYRVYTPFWRALEASGGPPEPVAAPSSLATPERWPLSESLENWHLVPGKPNWAAGFSTVWTPGEAGAHDKLARFLAEGIDGYKAKRDYPALRHTSELSPHIALGEISPASVWHATRGLTERIAAEDVLHFRKELAWRDFSYHLLFHFPDLATKNWNARFDAFPWENTPELFERWARGQTGYPIVDAGMRQLWRHGTMHNRVRMIVASFLIKDLMIDWRKGERWFRDTLVDADPGSNAASWQWVAGSGADASPFFRIFNPVSQGEKFDINGDYVRTFVPELARLGSAFIHRPFEAPKATLSAAGIVLGETYPLPIVDHGKARARAMLAYQSLPRAGGNG
ncbi:MULTISPECIES: cryptochrome/photolyase family protein [Alphaproteobacteria]|nr:deoxyribodipyrimidine photo-lyase [Sphingomonas psychrolutea]